MKRSEVNRELLSPMMRQYMEVKDNYQDVILFYRIGDFYEMFFEDAYEISRVLELTLTGKNAGLKERIPMCGIPHHAANIYLEKLVDSGYKVAICEQVEDPKDAKGIVKREVIRVVSKGTVMTDEMLDAKTNNFIGALRKLNDEYSLAYLDLSRGEFYCVLIDVDNNKIVNEILNDNIKELVLYDSIDPKVLSALKDENGIIISHENNIEEREE